MNRVVTEDAADAANIEGLGLFPYLAYDELFALEDVETGEDEAEFHDRVRARRAQLDEFSRHRLSTLGWDHQAIQALFDRLEIALYPDEA